MSASIISANLVHSVREIVSFRKTLGDSVKFSWQSTARATILRNVKGRIIYVGLVSFQ